MLRIISLASAVCDNGDQLLDRSLLSRRQLRIRLQQKLLVIGQVSEVWHQSDLLVNDPKQKVRRRVEQSRQCDDGISRRYARSSLPLRDRTLRHSRPCGKLRLRDTVRLTQRRYPLSYRLCNAINASPDERNRVLLEQNRTIVETSEKLMARRQGTSNLYTTLCSALIILLGACFVLNNLLIVIITSLPAEVIICFLCLNWQSCLKSYDMNNAGKFAVLNAIERRLPAIIFDCEYRYDTKPVSAPILHATALCP